MDYEYEWELEDEEYSMRFCEHCARLFYDLKDCPVCGEEGTELDIEYEVR